MPTFLAPQFADDPSPISTADFSSSNQSSPTLVPTSARKLRSLDIKSTITKDPIRRDQRIILPLSTVVQQNTMKQSRIRVELEYSRRNAIEQLEAATARLDDSIQYKFAYTTQVMAKRTLAVRHANLEAIEKIQRDQEKFKHALDQIRGIKEKARRQKEIEAQERDITLESARLQLEAARSAQLIKETEEQDKIRMKLAADITKNRMAPPNKDDYERPTAKARADQVFAQAESILISKTKIDQETTPSIKDTRTRIKMQVHRRIGQISDSMQQIISISNNLVKLVFESQQIQHAVGDYCLGVIADTVVEQGESLVALHTPSVYPIAAVCTKIAIAIPVFADILLAKLMKQCTYIIPRYVARQAGQSDRDYRIALGYVSTANGSLEAEQAYNERMSGLIALYAGLIQVGLSDSVLGLENGWVWLASILNLPPRPITPLLLCSFLEVAGFALWQAYQSHFIQLLVFIQNVYIARIPANCIAAKTRLELYLQTVSQKQFTRINEPEGWRIAP